MKRQYRLRKNVEFQRVRHSGHSKSNRLVVLIALPNHLPHSRFGFSVSKRIGNAVKRNKIKRQMREVSRLGLDTIKPGWDLLFIARMPINQARYEDIAKAMIYLLKQLNLYKKPNLMIGS